MSDTIKISCLPVAGIHNPYQSLMIKGLQSDPRLIVKNGINDRFFGILKTAIKQNPDYIHFDWEISYYYRRSLWMTLINVPFFILQVFIVRYIFNCKLVWTPHNIFVRESKYIKIQRFCRRFFAHNMDWIRLFSELTLSHAIDEFECNTHKFKIIPEGSYIGYYPNKMSRIEARKYFKINDDKLVLLFTGFIKPYKGIPELVESFKKTFSGNAVLIIAGKVMNVKYFENVRTSINEDIILVDSFIKNEELQLYFNAADVVVLPFKKIENSGSAILAMGFKKPVIAPKMGALTERLRNQAELLYEESLEESFTVLKGMSSTKLLEIGENNFRELAKYKWCDFVKAF